MLQSIRKRASILLLVISIFFTACSSAVSITTEPPGADVEINGQVKGKTPLNISLSDFVGNTYKTKFTLPGYKEKYVELQKEIKGGQLVGGFFIWPILLFCYGPESNQNFVLEPQK